MDETCSYSVGQTVSCSSSWIYGSLCVNAYSISSQNLANLEPVLLPADSPGPCVQGANWTQGLKNLFTVISRKTINGLNVAFGMFNVTVDVAPAAGIILSYFATNLSVVGSKPGVLSGVLSTQQGVLLPDCNQTGLRPCAVNIFDQSGTYGLFRTSTGVLDEYALAYWGNLSQDPWTTVKEQSPSLETVVTVCSSSSPPSVFDCGQGPDWLKNYFSPVPSFPAFVEVAVTPVTQSLACSASQYKAPHPPMCFKTSDYDGHRMTLYDFYSRTVNPSNTGSNRRSKCFRSEPDGTPSAMGASTGAYDPALSAGASWPWNRCLAYFDVDQDPARADGALVKFDFDFGNQDCGTAPDPARADLSALFGNLSGCGAALPTQCPSSRLFSQHIINTVDFPYVDVDEGAFYDPDLPPASDLLRWFSLVPPLSGGPVSPKGAVVQTVFAAYPCWSGPSNVPPTFVTGLDAAPGPCRGVPTGGADPVQTEYSCPAGGECVIALYARDYSVGADGLPRPLPATGASANGCPAPGGAVQSTDTVLIEPAAGWDAPSDFQVVVAHCSLNASRICVRDADCAPLGGACTGTTPSAAIQPPGAWSCTGGGGGAGGAVKCLLKQSFGPDDAGKFVVNCVTAQDLHPPATLPTDSRSCRSEPLCIKIKVTGTAPSFVPPTPLGADAVDAEGTPVTLVAACEGAPLQLTVAATDANKDDLVRLFVRDESGGGVSFFNDATRVAPACAGGQAFGPYGAKLGGAAAAQPNISQVLAIESAAGFGYIVPGSVMSPYAAGINYSVLPTTTVHYTLNLSLGDGIVVLGGSFCNQSNASATKMDSGYGRCLEPVLAVDRKVCAYAYDDSRRRLQRWVGDTDPNANSSSASHSDGDLYTKHCWQITLQAPPAFVTDPTRSSTPFPTSPDQLCDTRLTAGRQVRCFNVMVGETISKTFVAQDPNPGDSVSILLVDDPYLGGPPAGLSVGRTVCIPRVVNGSIPGEQVAGMCSPLDFSLVGSACSKAMLTVTWTPGALVAGGTFFACAAARDSSDLCAGVAAGATSFGWYGETHCIGFSVVSPTIEWAGTSDVRSGNLSEQLSFVGCQSRFNVYVVGHGTDSIEIFPVGPLPSGAILVDFQPDSGSEAVKQFQWTPRRGTEGANLTVCFSAKYAGGALRWGETGCRLLAVQRCQYCVSVGSTLSSLTKTYGLDTNWLRLWLHNSNLIDNPDLIPQTIAMPSDADNYQNALDATVLYVGPVYQVQNGDSLTTIAIKFRTTIAGLLSVNPDLSSAEEVAKGRELCIIPCSQQSSTMGMAS